MFFIGDDMKPKLSDSYQKKLAECMAFKASPLAHLSPNWVRIRGPDIAGGNHVQAKESLNLGENRSMGLWGDLILERNGDIKGLCPVVSGPRLVAGK